VNNLPAEIMGYFEKFQDVFLATIEDDKPKVRPMSMVYLDSKFWFLTGTQDAKMDQIRKNPKIEWCYMFKKGDHVGYIRGNGTADVITDIELKTSIANRVEYFDQHWGSPDDPNYTLIEVNTKEVEYMKPGEYIAQRFHL